MKTIKINITRAQIDNALASAGIDQDYFRPLLLGPGGWTLVVDDVVQFALFLVDLTALLAEDTVNDEDPDITMVTDPVRALARRTKIHGHGVAGQLVISWPGVQLNMLPDQH